VAELALDHRQRDPFVQELDRVSMSQLVRGYAPAHAGLDRGAMELQPGGAL
jgi:hypothetical protein